MAENDARGPVDQLTLRELAVQEDYEVETPDGWTLVVTRYRPRPQLWGQPLAGVPMLLVHGFSQNRATWTSGEFARDLAYFGADIHILELRGHGKSSRSLQFRKHNREGKRLPNDISWNWDVDSYFLQDVPAAIEAVKRRTGRDKLVYIGHSMGGMIGYGIASLRQEDLLGLVTIGSPSDIGQDFLGLQALAWAALALPAIDYALWWVSFYRGLDYRTRRGLLAAASRLGPVRRLAERTVAPPEKAPKPLRFTVFPIDFMLKTAATLVTDPETALGKLPRYIPLMYNQARVDPERVKSLLTIGGGPEPRGVVEQFCRWIRNNELKCYRTDYDFKANFERITIPLAIIFGDEDKVARIASTRSIYRNARSNFLLWRPVRGNSHIDVTMGYDIRQIVYDIKNLADYAILHQQKAPTLPTRDAPVGESLPGAARSARGKPRRRRDRKAAAAGRRRTSAP